MRKLFKFQKDGPTGGRTDGQTDGRTDRVIPIYPPPNFVCGGYKNSFFTVRLKIKSLTVSEIKGAKGGQKCDFGAYIKFSFFIKFWRDIFCLILLSESFHNCYSWFFLSCTVGEISYTRSDVTMDVLACKQSDLRSFWIDYSFNLV